MSVPLASASGSPASPVGLAALVLHAEPEVARLGGEGEDRVSVPADLRHGAGDELVGRLPRLVADAQAAVDGEDDELLARRPQQVQPRQGEDQQDDDRRAAAQRERSAASAEVDEAAVEVVGQHGQREQAEEPPGAGQLQGAVSPSPSVDPPPLIEEPLPAGQHPRGGDQVVPDRPAAEPGRRARPSSTGRPPAGRRSLSRRLARLQASSASGGDSPFRPCHASRLGRALQWRTTLQTPQRSSGPTATFADARRQGALAAVGRARDRVALGSVSAGRTRARSRRRRRAPRAARPCPPANQPRSVGHQDRERGPERQVALVEVHRQHEDLPLGPLERPRTAGRRVADSASTCAARLAGSACGPRA